MAQGDSNQYGYGLDPMLMSALVAALTKGQSAQSGRLNDFASLLFDPQFAAFSGNFDPAYTQQQQFSPSYGPYLSSSLKSPVPIWQQAAQSIINGDIDPTSAVLEVASALGVTEDVPNEQGLTFDAIQQQVTKMFDEAGAAMKQEQDFYDAQNKAYTDSVFGKAGLPAPQAQYTISEEMAMSDPMRYVALPYSQEYQDMIERYNKQMREVSGLQNAVNTASNREFKTIYEKMMDDYADKKKAEEDKRAAETQAGAVPTEQANSPIPIAAAEVEGFAQRLGISASDVEKARRSAIADIVTRYEVPESDVFKYERSRSDYENRFKQYLQRETDINIDTVGSFTPAAQQYFDTSVDEFRTDTQNRADQDQEARRGIAMSYEAQKKAKAAPVVTEAQKKANLESGRAVGMKKDANTQRLIDLYLANLTKRTPTSDALQARMYAALGM